MTVKRSTTMEQKTPAKASGDARSKSVLAALAEIEKQYGAGAIMKMGEQSHLRIERFPSGSLSLDIALGGGVPKGRVIEIFGPESSGKTTLALHMVAEIQKLGGQAAFIDAEHALDIQYAKRIGVDIDNLLVSQPDDGESALEITETLVRSGGVDVIVIDSVAALTPRAEIEGMMGDAHMGLQARLMSQALRKLTAIVAKTSCSVIFINQIRMKIGVMFGNPETTPGGNALKFYSSLRLDVRRIEKITGKAAPPSAGPGGAAAGRPDIVGNRVRVKVVKNKTAPPFREAEFDLIYNSGISREGDLLDLGLKYGLVAKSGAFFSFGDASARSTHSIDSGSIVEKPDTATMGRAEQSRSTTGSGQAGSAQEIKLGQGREQAKEFLAKQEKVAKELEKGIMARALSA